MRRPAADVGCASALLLALLSLVGCGREPQDVAVPTTGGWQVVELAGVAGASGVAVLGDQLLIVAGGDERRLFLQPRADLRPGVRAEPRPLRFEVNREARLEGTVRGRREDAFVAQDYRLGALWDLPVDIQGIAARHVAAGAVGPAVDFLYVLERSFGLVYRGRLLRDAAGALAAARLDAAFVVPDRKREGSRAADWRDSSPTLVGILSVPREDRDEDLYLLDDGTAEAPGFQVLRLDRFGAFQGRFRVRLPEGGVPDMGDLSWIDERFVFVRGLGRGALVSCQDPGDVGAVTLGVAVPAPEAPGAGPWRGLAHAGDGTAYLVSAGSPSRIAWRPR